MVRFVRFGCIGVTSVSKGTPPPTPAETDVKDGPDRPSSVSRHSVRQMGDSPTVARYRRPLMPVPFPTETSERLGPPALDEVHAVAGAFTAALSGPDGLTELQTLVMHAMTKSMTGFDVDYATVAPKDAGRAGRRPG